MTERQRKRERKRKRKREKVKSFIDRGSPADHIFRGVGIAMTLAPSDQGNITGEVK